MGFLEITVNCEEHFVDIFIAEMAALGFDAFVENEKGFTAYIEQPEFEQEALTSLGKRYEGLSRIDYLLKNVEKQNWNEVWERNYDPIFIGDQCVVRASFHDIPKKYPYEILINPKMSFGTGHHETTYLMLKSQMEMNFKTMKVLDVGCGTGILAIMSSFLGAEEVTACDIDEWCVENSLENVRINHCENIKIKQCDITGIDGQYDIILANINRNVLLHDLPYYGKLLKENGDLLLSGFYKEDVPAIKQAAEKNGFLMNKISNKHNWSCVLFEK